jgi:hypothetical protein
VVVSLEISPEAAKLQTNKGKGMSGEILATFSFRKYVSSILCLYSEYVYCRHDGTEKTALICACNLPLNVF